MILALRFSYTFLQEINKKELYFYSPFFTNFISKLVFMYHSGSADLPLHNGRVPAWLAERMARIGGAVVSSIVQYYGQEAFLSRISDPFWFQALGCVMGMDWHSSGITTSVLGALKKSLNPQAGELGIYICGGRGKHSLKTPQELLKIGDKEGLNADQLVYNSRLTAKVDNTALQDGFQLYLHSFIVTNKGEWAVVQQGMNGNTGWARRYHWHSPKVRSFVEEPHTAIYGRNQGNILNLVHHDAAPAREGILKIVKEDKLKLNEIPRMILPRHHEVRQENVNLKRLGAVLALAQNMHLPDFESLLLLKGAGPRTLQSLTLVSEVIHGTPSRFSDPARFSFAHGGKDGHPFPVPVTTYDETINILETAVEKGKLGHTDKQHAIRQLHHLSAQIEKDFKPNQRFDELLEKEKAESYKYGGRTVFGKAKPPEKKVVQLKLF